MSPSGSEECTLHEQATAFGPLGGAVLLTTFGIIAVALVATMLGFIALLACYVPARRATRIDPLVALRSE